MYRLEVDATPQPTDGTCMVCVGLVRSYSVRLSEIVMLYAQAGIPLIFSTKRATCVVVSASYGNVDVCDDTTSELFLLVGT